MANTVIKEHDSNASHGNASGGDDIGFYAKECDTFTAVDRTSAISGPTRIVSAHAPRGGSPNLSATRADQCEVAPACTSLQVRHSSAAGTA